MTRPRKVLISLDATPYYHCVSRCVRRAFLCGTDKMTGNSYEHRRQWIEDRLIQLSQVFAIDLCAYAIMSNHYHVVLHVGAEQANTWSEKEIAQRWHSLFKGTVLTRKFVSGENLDKIEYETVKAKIELWRKHLSDISWFMRCVNEHIARESNREDHCTGRFWEGRFKSQALLDEQALAACMAYVDLNPIRAGIAPTPESSDHTSIKRRINTAEDNKQENQLYPFVGNPRDNMPKGLPFHLRDYIELVDWTGRMIRENKRGAVPSHLPHIMKRIGVDPKHWLYLATKFDSRFKTIVGTAYTIRQKLDNFGRQRNILTAVIQV